MAGEPIRATHNRAMRFVLICLLALSAAAQEHRVSRIEVRGNVPAPIVVAQSALSEGRGYSTSDLDAGIARLRRLPFVYDARYVLDGDTLRIEVTGETPLFAEIDAFGLKSEVDESAGALVSAGGRHFLGASVVEARVSNFFGEGDDPRDAQLRYSHYSIGGTRLFAAVTGSFELNEAEGFESDPAFALLAGYPLTVRQTITASAYRTGRTSRMPLEVTDVETEEEITGTSLRWTFDTTDDPYFARRGTMLSAGPSLTRYDSEFSFEFTPPPPFDPIVISGGTAGDIRSLDAELTHFQPFRARGAFFGNAAVSFVESEFELRNNDEEPLRDESESTTLRLSLGYGHNFFDREAPLTNGRHRIEIAAAASRFDTDQAIDDYSLLLGYVFRARFARVGVNLTYVFDQTDTPTSVFRYTAPRDIAVTR